VQSPPPCDRSAWARAVGDLADETVLLFHRLRTVVADLHGAGELTASYRGVVRDLYHRGPQTVAAMARRRPVSRQHIQSLVDGLVGRGHVRLVDNPAHKRSRLVELTESGRSLAEEMWRREAALLGEIDATIDVARLEQARETLSDLRQLLAADSTRAAIALIREGSREGSRGGPK
jgi:DNA-binding MarR family transcriptional regulator